MATILNVIEREKPWALSLGAVQDPVSGQLIVPSGMSLIPFSNWLPPTVVSTAIAAAQARGISLSQLLSGVTTVIKNAFSDAVWVRIEVSELQSRSGHLYLGAIERDEDGRELAKSRANIWAAQVTKLVAKFSSMTGTELASGIKLLVLAKPTYHAQHGFSLHILDIDPSYTLGDMAARLRQIRAVLAADGIAGRNRALPTPDDFHHIAVISPDGAAGLEDFQVEAKRLSAAGLCRFTYFNAVFQGERVRATMKEAFVAVHDSHLTSPFCALAIIRGGGAAADLHWLNELLLARMICRFHCPVLTGIGHERDTTILDEYAHRSFGTPSKVVAHIKDVIAARAIAAHDHWTAITQTMHNRLASADARLDQRHGDIVAAAMRMVDQATYAASERHAEIAANAHAAVDLADAHAQSHHSGISAAATSVLDVAGERVGATSDAINERARRTMDIAETGAQTSLDAVTLAARRTIDGIDEHLAEQWRSIGAGAQHLAGRCEVMVEKDYADLRFHAMRAADFAVDQTEEVMAGILAHGIEPTLRRGYALVRTPVGPVSSLAGAQHHDELDLVFRDGSMKVLRREDNG